MKWVGLWIREEQEVSYAFRFDELKKDRLSESWGDAQAEKVGGWEPLRVSDIGPGVRCEVLSRLGTVAPKARMSRCPLLRKLPLSHNPAWSGDRPIWEGSWQQGGLSSPRPVAKVKL